MTLRDVPLLALVIAATVVGAVVTRFVPDDRKARQVAIGSAVTALLLSIVALAVFRGNLIGLELFGSLRALPLVRIRLGLGVDGFSLGLVVLACALSTAVLVAAPRKALARGSIVAVLMTTSASVATVCSTDLVVIAALYLASIMPTHDVLSLSTRDERALVAFRALLFLGALPLIALVVVVGYLGFERGSATPFELSEAIAAGLPPGLETPLFVATCVTALARMGVVPLHAWLPSMLERAPIGVAVVLANVHLGLFLLARIAIPLCPTAATQLLPALAVLGLVSAIYGALLAFPQTLLTRAIGYLMTSHAGYMLMGIATSNEESVHGAMLQSIAISTSTTGLLLVIAAIEARTGTTDLRKLGGLFRNAPRMAAAFLIFLLASIGFPGTLSFVSEDLLLHGALETHVGVAMLFLFATALNGITLLRAFHRTFFGPLSETNATIGDMLLRERAIAMTLIGLLFFFGVAPGPLIELRREPVRRLVPEAEHPQIPE